MIPVMGVPQVVVEGLRFPEGAFWSAQDRCLYFVEWAGDVIWRRRETKMEPVHVATPGDGPCAVWQTPEGNLWVTMYSGRRVALLDRCGRELRQIDSYRGERLRGPNHVVADGCGHVYFTDSGDFEEDWRSGRQAGSVYHASPAGEVHRLARGLCYPNGIALSRDGRRLFVNEHRRNRVLWLAIPSAEDAEPHVLAQLDDDCVLGDGHSFELGPDGLTRDKQDRLWVPHYGGGRVMALDLEGREIARVRLPRGRKPTDVAVDEEEQALYVTEAEDGLLYRVPIA